MLPYLKLLAHDLIGNHLLHLSLLPPLHDLQSLGFFLHHVRGLCCLVLAAGGMGAPLGTPLTPSAFLLLDDVLALVNQGSQALLWRTKYGSVHKASVPVMRDNGVLDEAG